MPELAWLIQFGVKNNIMSFDGSRASLHALWLPTFSLLLLLTFFGGGSFVWANRLASPLIRALLPTTMMPPLLRSVDATYLDALLAVYVARNVQIPRETTPCVARLVFATP